MRLGGSPGLQKDFLDTLASERSIRPQERYRKQQPPLANAFALGYTYQDVLDADQEGGSPLARSERSR